jgi:hypothetical protein
VAKLLSSGPHFWVIKFLHNTNCGVSTHYIWRGVVAENAVDMIPTKNYLKKKVLPELHKLGKIRKE